MANNRSLTNVAILFTEKIIVLFLGFITTLLLARQLGPEVFGQYSVILASAFMFFPLTQMGLNNLCGKYFSLYPNNLHYYFRAALAIRITFSALALCLVTLVHLFYSQHSTSLLILLLVLLQSANCVSHVEFAFLSNENAKTTALIRIFTKLFCKVSLLYLISINASLTLLILFTGLEYLLSAIGYIWIYRRHNYHYKIGSRTSIKHVASKLFHQSKWLALSGFASIIYLKIDQVMIAYYLNHKAVGEYAAALKFSELWFVFPTIVANILMPKLVNLYKRDRFKFWDFQRKLITLSTVSSLLLITIFALSANSLIFYIYGTEYSNSALILKVHITATLFIFFRAFLSKWLILSRNYNLSLYSHCLGAVVNIILNALLIPTYGTVGAAVASVIAYFVSSILFLFLFERGRVFIKNYIGN
ncbi:flippase [Pseudoalteromonas fenneropenaei]|uniref:Flippase n=1 Tax=Pseudoalteromonas fenneropenaei TaxID=1737459 RepID=A0ABV7CKE3_9GAMM